jgi:hypothetical protein
MSSLGHAEPKTRLGRLIDKGIERIGVERGEA